jgi:hypothetical protein
MWERPSSIKKANNVTIAIFSIRHRPYSSVTVALFRHSSLIAADFPFHDLR